LLPFSFDVGLNQLMSALVSGARLVILDSWLPTDILNAIATQEITGISGVPSIWLSLLKARKPIDREGPHAALRYLTISGGDMEVEQLQRFAASAPGVAIYKTYGQTESFRSTALLPAELAARPTSVGKPFATAKVYIVRPDGTRAGTGERGEVVHTGLGVMLGYLNGSSVDAKRRCNPFLGPDDASPFAIFTGDQGHLDEQGFLFLAGRQDDMVKVAGNRVHLAELSAEMARVPGVFAAEAVSVPVDGADPLLAVFVLPEHADAGLTTQVLGAEAARRLPTYMLPRLIELRASFPLTASGKPDRQALRAEAARLLQPTPESR
jgi:acyl-CoA synthetase (AMP-forming)/AMP-acid ligase II